jgi:hypothetical protein
MRFIQNFLALCSAASVLAAPTSLEARQTSLNGKNLRILPLGDSITVSGAQPNQTSTNVS